MNVELYTRFTYLPNNTQASGAQFDMVMSTKEQDTFEAALSARDGFESIKKELSQVDVRQVRAPPWLFPRARVAWL